jgi:hypothetical protein
MRPTEARLRLAFAEILGSVLTTAGAITVASATACGGAAAHDPNAGNSQPTVGTPTPGVDTAFRSACGDLATKTLLDDFNASPPVDGAEQRSETAFKNLGSPGMGVVPYIPPGEDDQWTASNGPVSGELCKTATDKNACLAKVDGYRVLPVDRSACVMQYASSNNGYGPACTVSYILYTRGDEIGVARTNDETHALIGTIDTLDEALWAAGTQGYQRVCNNQPSDSTYRTTSDGGYDLTVQKAMCGAPTILATVHVDPAGKVTLLSTSTIPEQPCAIAGRRPDGFGSSPVAADDAVGAYFASMATLEAASIVAFRRLGRELAALGAPRALLDRIARAAKDEIRHARATRALAEKYGATPAAPRVAPASTRSLYAIAEENAREGCVRETFGALVAHLQRVRATDADVRASMEAIADEETEHAALSWDIAAWLEAQLGNDERARLADVRREAAVELARELAAPVDARVRSAAGLPSVGEALTMLATLEDRVVLAA